MYNEKISENIGLGPTLVQVDQQNFEMFPLESDSDSKVSFIHKEKLDYIIRNLISGFTVNR